LLNAWPLDEGHIDYVEDAGSFTNIINDESITIDAATLEGMNESPGEKDIATGYHAIEFLLWGQDTNPNGPGQRPFTDYVTDGSGTADHQERRGEYLLTVSELLQTHLTQLVDAWAPAATGNYRASFEAETPSVALGRIMSGMIILSGFETGAERLQVALEEQSQEEEHSCFSDNTHRDMIQDVLGVQNVWLGRYGSVAGTGIRDVIAAGDADLAADVTAQIQESLDLAEALQPPFDREIMAGNTAGNARVDALIVALFELRTVLEGAFELYGLTRIPDPE
jgi:putative iron-regulated protein